MEATYSSETSVEFHRITRLYFPEDSSSKWYTSQPANSVCQSRIYN
jgi:hypothetical protein